MTIKGLHEALADWRREYLAAVLKAANNNVAEAAKIAGKSRKYMYKLIAQSRVQRTYTKPGRRASNEGNAAWNSLAD